MELQRGVQRWVVDISQWNPSPSEFSYAMSFLPQHEHHSITRYLKLEDRKRAIVSRLLQYALVHEVFGIPFDEIIIKRTVEGKPYLSMQSLILALIPGLLHVGFAGHIGGYLCRYWCVKEAFVKAIGTGVGYRLDSVEFHHTMWTNISVKLDGRELKEWKFWLYDFGKRHMVSIARGHPRIATETYKRTLKRTEFDEEQYHLGLNLPNVSFVQQTVEQLIPVSFKSGGNIGQEHDACQAEEIGNSKP